MSSSTLPLVDQVARLQKARDAVHARSSVRPRVGLVLGSGLGGFAAEIAEPVRVAYRDIPGMPGAAVEGHAGQLLLGDVEGVPVACLAGRAHLYEGHPVSDVVFGVRLLVELGCHSVLLTNAAGGIAPRCAAGALMLITDHLNLTGHNPLQGPNDARLGVRFPDLSVAYDEAVRAAALAAAAEVSVQLEQGVYAGLLGPTYETPAEVRMLQRLGADAVGMSTVLEVIALRHRGARVGAVSCITNAAAGVSNAPLDHAEVQETAARVADQFQRLVRRWVVRVDESGADAA